MKIYPTTEIIAKWDIVTSVDTTSATVRMFIDGEWHTGAWMGSALPQDGNWIRTAILPIGGIDTDAEVKLTYQQEPLVEVTLSGQVLVEGTGMVRVTEHG